MRRRRTWLVLAVVALVMLTAGTSLAQGPIFQNAGPCPTAATFTLAALQLCWRADISQAFIYDGSVWHQFVTLSVPTAGGAFTPPAISFQSLAIVKDIAGLQAFPGDLLIQASTLVNTPPVGPGVGAAVIRLRPATLYGGPAGQCVLTIAGGNGAELAFALRPVWNSQAVGGGSAEGSATTVFIQGGTQGCALAKP